MARTSANRAKPRISQQTADARVHGMHGVHPKRRLVDGSASRLISSMCCCDDCHSFADWGPRGQHDGRQTRMARQVGSSPSIGCPQALTAARPVSGLSAQVLTGHQPARPRLKFDCSSRPTLNRVTLTGHEATSQWSASAIRSPRRKDPSHSALDTLRSRNGK